MNRSTLKAVPWLLVGMFAWSLAYPASQSQQEANGDEIQKRQQLANASILALVLATLQVAQAGLGITASVISAVVSEMGGLVPTAKPASAPGAVAVATSIYRSKPSNTIQRIELIEQFIVNGLNPSGIETVLNFGDVPDNAANNVNPRNPTKTIYPKASSADAPYPASESELRSQIFIPSGFTYGKKRPMLMVPGTANRGGNTYVANLRKSLAGRQDVDMVWINPKLYLLADAQYNSALVAYAINYISGISGNSNISVVAFSQGNINTQWALKYWPSTRKVVSDFIGISPDFHGTIESPILCNAAEACAPALRQQFWASSFINALRASGGDSAYVPSTLIYSSMFDEIVEPQQGTGASGYLNDARNVGVTNNEVQSVCSGVGIHDAVTHESLLIHPLTTALVIDALEHDGPGRPGRLNMVTACTGLVAPGLGLVDYLANEELIIFTVLQLILYQPKTLFEPIIASYAQKG